MSVAAGRDALVLGPGWSRRWTATLRTAGEEVSCAIRDLAQAAMVPGGSPMRGFSWRRAQRHRPGLHFLVSTGRHHGAESLEEARVLLAMDFAADLVDVVSQPMRLRFDTETGRRAHIPDFLAVTRTGMWLVDVRPQPLIGPDDLVAFAAAAEVALACGWRYVVAAGWREHVAAAVDVYSSQRRPLSDPFGLRPVLLAAACGGGTFGELAEAAPFPPLGRAQLLHLLWHRTLGADLSRPFGDRSMVINPAGRTR
ncbi:TnsA-like heteromeric transposase endonuclease subunit [Streptomyces sp. NPDC127197]|uniref:TnsA-like heteromeric transposase endonuclease subunit n=1 Tax=Streptomyces sp. NPDC127197 TaxID=3345388 RepID=UPI003625C636